MPDRGDPPLPKARLRRFIIVVGAPVGEGGTGRCPGASTGLFGAAEASRVPFRERWAGTLDRGIRVPASPAARWANATASKGVIAMCP